MRKKIVLAYVIITSVLLLEILVPNTNSRVNALHSNEYEHFANELVEYVENGEWQKADNLLLNFQDELLKEREKSNVRNTLLSNVIELQQIIDQPVYSNQIKKDKAVRISYLVQAIGKNSEDFWQVRKNMFEQKLMKISVSIDKKDKNWGRLKGELKQEYENLFAVYDVMYPAIENQQEWEDLRELVGQIINSKEFDDNTEEAIMTMEDKWAIVAQSPHRQADDSFWRLLLTIGSILTATLSYVAWRKFLAES
ncbi:sporulation protein YpjB [Bacillaceae bacterium S4-13-56]